jgi:pimeloyl-ACP methyl ester carboxylesterase
MTDGFVTLDCGARLFFHRRGDGAPLVVPNGLAYGSDFDRLGESHTVVAYDVRNRGRSDAVTDPALLARGIYHDVDDLETMRRHCGFERMRLLGLSYQGLTCVLYAARHPERVERVLAIGIPPPSGTAVYASDLSGRDEVFATVMGQLAAFQRAPPPLGPEARCRAFWEILRPLYVVDPSLAVRADWERCNLPNERAAFAYFSQHLLPSMQALSLTADDLVSVTAPVLLIHGRRDRSAPYGGALDWLARLPNARLLTVPDAAHVPWLEAPDQVWHACDTFFAGRWPADAKGGGLS